MALFVDGREHSAAPDKNLLEHLLGLGYDVPYFCWHPAMGSVGACRQCAVKQYRDENDRAGRVVMACMTPAADGARVGFDEPEVRDFRARVVEWLMVNHPHDCPVCEEGGECHLQDMTVMTGHNYRRYRGKKRTFRNQYLGPFVNHEMNRCIACYRCVRFYQDYAGGDDLRAFGIHSTVFFGRAADGVLENEFSGNLAEVCPTGVFTDKTFADRYVRKWDLQAAPSVCTHCGVGCNTSAQERYGRLRRIVNRYNGAVNGYFICDRGRFGYGFVNSPKRVRAPLVRAASGALEPATAEAALARAAQLVAGGNAIGIGSPRASLESNYALRRLVGPENFYFGVTRAEQLEHAADIVRSGLARVPSVRDAERADAVLVLGDDVTATAPRLALALRQAVRQRQLAAAARLSIPAWLDAAVRTAGQDVRSPLYLATPAATKLDDVATAAWRAAPERIAALGQAIAHALDAAAPAPAALPDDAAALARDVAAALAAAERPLVVTGTSSDCEAVLDAAANVARALRKRRGSPADLYVALPEANSLGLALLGGRSLDAAFGRAREGRADAAIVLENDLGRRAPQPAVERFFADVAHVIALDHLEHSTVAAAEVVLPAATFAEGDGTLVSSEGRAQRFFQVYVPENGVRESWRWLAALAAARGAGEAFGWDALDDVTAECAAAVPALAKIAAAAPSARFRIVGRRVAREPARYSGRTAQRAHVDIRERPPPADDDAPLAFSMEGYYGPRVPPPLLPFAWAPQWNSNQSINKFQQEIGGPLRGGDPGVRLLAASPAAGGDYCALPEEAARDADGALRLVRLPRIFGGEELSAESPPVAERTPKPHVMLHSADAERLGLADGELVELTLGAITRTLPLACAADFARGIVGVPADAVPPVAGGDSRATVRRAEAAP